MKKTQLSIELLAVYVFAQLHPNYPYDYYRQLCSAVKYIVEDGYNKTLEDFIIHLISFYMPFSSARYSYMKLFVNFVKNFAVNDVK